MTTGELLLQAQSLEQMRVSRYAQRKLINRVALALSLMAMAFGLFWLVWPMPWMAHS